MGLAEEVHCVLRDAIRDCPDGIDCAPLLSEIRSAISALEQPMKVAVIGLAKAGKSTLMNALLRADLVATDDSICTSKITFFRYSQEEMVRYHFLDGSVRVASLAELHSATRRGGNEALQSQLSFVEVLLSNPALTAFDLIDTPGGESHLISDSAETRAFMEGHGYEAIVYVFRQGVHQKSAETVSSFRGVALNRSTPLNSIGVLSCIDRYWQNLDDDPLGASSAVVDRLRSEPAVQELFFRIFPICGLLAFAAYTLDDATVQALRELGNLPREHLGKLLRNASRLVKDYPTEEILVSARVRQGLLDRFGLYGIWVAVEILRGGDIGRTALAASLLQASGMVDLERALKGHFGARSFLIKWNSVRWSLRRVAFRERDRGSHGVRSAAADILSRLEELESEEFRLEELRVLSDLYDRQLEMSGEELSMVQCALGERGDEVYQLLGFDHPPGLTELTTRVRHLLERWQFKCVDPIPRSMETQRAEAAMVRCLERIEMRVRDLHQ
jgi:Dynamin family